MRHQKFRGNVFVANLPKGYTDVQLAQAFDRFGIVMGACLARDLATGEVKGHGLVDLAPKGAAEQAVIEMNGIEIGGRRIEARLADPNMALTVPARLEAPERSDHRSAARSDHRSSERSDHRSAARSESRPPMRSEGHAPAAPPRPPVRVEYRTPPRRSS
jgi:RNA recognition motif-containing protein